MRALRPLTFLSLVLVFFSASLCVFADAEPAAPSISGPIGDPFLHYVRPLPPDSTVVMNSLGGSAEVGMDVAAFIQHNRIRVRIEEFCLSACAEYILPAAESVELGPQAIIGFHGGDFLFENLAAEAEADNSCAAPRTAAFLPPQRTATLHLSRAALCGSLPASSCVCFGACASRGPSVWMIQRAWSSACTT